MTAPDLAPAPLRVVVVDADERTRDSLCGLLSIGDRCVVVGSASQPDQALALVADKRPDVVIVDPRLPGLDGIKSFTTRVRAAAPGARIVLMGSFEANRVAPLPLGADGWIRKTFRPRELLDAVMAVAAAPPT
ncbi:MAG: response regulator transcription factor [Chloroflexota bacterium]